MSNSIHSETHNTVRVSARRFETSPFQACWKNEHTVMGVYAGRYYSVFNGEDTEAAYWLLRRKAAIYDVPERPVEISGPDAVAFLERIFARNIASLKAGRGRYAIACTPAGGVFMDGILFKLADNRFWYVQPDGALESWLLAHSEGFDVTISDPQSRVLQIQGPASFDIMAAASDGKIDDTMGRIELAAEHPLFGNFHSCSKLGCICRRHHPSCHHLVSGNDRLFGYKSVTKVYLSFWVLGSVNQRRE